MKRLLLPLAILFSSYAVSAQNIEIQPKEIYVIGNLKLRNFNNKLYAAVYDSRTDMLYEFPLPEGDLCGQLVQGKEYRFRLLASCNGTDCYEANYQLVDQSVTVKQAQRDIAEISHGAAIKFETNTRPRKY